MVNRASYGNELCIQEKNTMKFVIRDDDLNYFSKPEDIQRWYTDIFSKDIPVGFATIPFVKPESDVYTGGAEFESREYAVHENEELVLYVKNNPSIEILQHGTTHETVNGVYEYARILSKDETKRGREELERTFDKTVNIFVPPHDWIGTSGIKSVENAGMNIIRGRGAGLRNVILRWEYVTVFVRMLFFKVRHLIAGRKVLAYPFVLNFGKHKEMCSYRLEDTDVFEGLAYAHKRNGIFVVVTHLHFYTEEKKERLLALIQKAKEYNAEFIRPSEIFSA